MPRTRRDVQPTPPGPAARTSRCRPIRRGLRHLPRQTARVRRRRRLTVADRPLRRRPGHSDRRAAPASGKQTKSRAIAGLVSAVLGSLLVAGGLYLIGEFGFRIFDVMLNVGGQPATWDIVWTSTGAALIFVAVLLNGWSPWATLLPGLALTARRRLVHRLVRRRRPGGDHRRPAVRPAGNGRLGHHRLDAGASA